MDSHIKLAGHGREGSFTQRYVKRQEPTGESAGTRCLHGFPFPFLRWRFQDVFWGVACLPDPALFIGAVILPEPINRLGEYDGMVGDGSPDQPSTLVGRSMAEAILKDTVHYPLIGESSITSESGRQLSIDLFRRIVSGNFASRTERRL